MNVRSGIVVLMLALGVGLVSGQTMVYLESSETLSFDQSLHPDAQILRGNVRFRHEDAVMYCDSAYFYEQRNSLDALGHVRMVQGDTLFGYGDRLYYDGNTKLARFRSRVRLEHHSSGLTTLKTDSLNYDRAKGIAYYFTGGTIQDSLNTLTSVWGQYVPADKQSEFRRKVKLTNPNFILTSDTLRYNTDTKVADIVGPTDIVYEEETTIHSTRGWYNTETEKSLLLKRSEVVHVDGKSMTGDSIYYDKKVGFGRVIGDMQLKDTAQKVTLYGNYGEMYEGTDDVGSHGYATDSALMVDWSDEEQYTYMHADTLFTEEPDTNYRRVRAYYNVRVYREDLQAVCDSLVYNGRDSIMTLYTQPVCWSDSLQLSADSIMIYMKNGTVEHMQGIGNALAVKQETDKEYNQMAGKELTGYIRDEELRQVDVSGNAETRFYPKQEDGSFVGLNTTQSSYVKLFLENQKIHHILFTSQTTGVLYPMDQIPSGKAYLTTFFWAETERPMLPGDVFLHPQRTPRAGAVGKSAQEEVREEKKPDANAEKQANARKMSSSRKQSNKQK